MVMEYCNRKYFLSADVDAAAVPRHSRRLRCPTLIVLEEYALLSVRTNL